MALLPQKSERLGRVKEPEERTGKSRLKPGNEIWGKSYPSYRGLCHRESRSAPTRYNGGDDMSALPVPGEGSQE